MLARYPVDRGGGRGNFRSYVDYRRFYYPFDEPFFYPPIRYDGFASYATPYYKRYTREGTGAYDRALLLF